MWFTSLSALRRRSRGRLCCLFEVNKDNVYNDERADVTAAILICLGGACFGFYPYGLIISRWKNLIIEPRKFLINHILILNIIFSISDLLEFLENVQIIEF